MSFDSIPQTEGGFALFGLQPSLQRAVADAGFTEPRPIQNDAIPAVLAGRDVLGLAQTGTGKTAAFVLPILERLLARPAPGPRALILAPTRELAAQIHAEILALARHTRIKAVTVFGGVSQVPQVRGLRGRPDIVVACPGRLLDLMQQRLVDLRGVEVLVLDEADHMFDLGFLPPIRKIIAALPAKRQNLMFSATMPSEIRKLADTVLHKPHVVELASSRPAETIDHAIFGVEQDKKIELLKHLLKNEATSTIVFSRTKQRAKRLADHLQRDGHSAVALQGNMSQGQRDRAMQGFRAGHFDVLVATDIAARGIDVEKVSHVINFDVPNTPDAYTHRIGRTGRAERSGKAYTFASREDHEAVRAIERRLGQPIARRQVPSGLVGAKLAPPQAMVSTRPSDGPRAHHRAGPPSGRPRRFRSRSARR
jgi:ATP-dependent RNA helicase RhlE